MNVPPSPLPRGPTEFGPRSTASQTLISSRLHGAWALQGKAICTIEGHTAPFPPPAEPGIAEHWWGEDYTFAFSYVGLDER